MLFLFNSNTDNIRIFVCPPTFWTYDGFSGRCLTTRQVFSLYIGSYEYILFVIWQMLLPFFVADVFPLFCIVGRCYCHIFVEWCYCKHVWLVADVVATLAMVCATCGNVYIWQLLLPSWLGNIIAIHIAVFVADVIATIANDIAINKSDVIGTCYLTGW